ncbi:MAG: hypothetical protein GEU73_05965 [Chloroflexi bacterium]|nr:hypothetical protein [Chloroflexota bacterium]
MTSIADWTDRTQGDDLAAYLEAAEAARALDERKRAVEAVQTFWEARRHDILQELWQAERKRDAARSRLEASSDT